MNSESYKPDVINLLQNAHRNSAAPVVDFSRNKPHNYTQGVVEGYKSRRT